MLVTSLCEARSILPTGNMSNIANSGVEVKSQTSIETCKVRNRNLRMMNPNLNPTALKYYDDMWELQSTATILSSSMGEDGRHILVLDSTIFHPQGGGQPSDTGSISNLEFNFIVQDVRSKDKIVCHYGHLESSKDGAFEKNIERGTHVFVGRWWPVVNGRWVNGRLHSAGHLLDVCVKNVGWDHLEPTKGYHFPDGPYVEYKGIVPKDELETKRNELEVEANNLISKGGNVSVSVLPYDKASELCGGSLPDYIPKETAPRIVKLEDYPGCPCGGTHVSDIKEILKLKVSQIRTKKGQTKVFYNIE